MPESETRICQNCKASFVIDASDFQFYEKIKNPVFLNLRYNLNNLNATDAYPKSLPDFYKNAEFTLYGSYTNEDVFSMQLLGDIDGQTKELVFSRSLSQAKKGGADIKKGYGFNKVYHLISQISEKGYDPSVKAEIDTLSKKYGVVTPYSPEREKMD